MRAFSRYIGIDYSGANRPTKSLPGLRVYDSDGGEPFEVQPPPSPRKYWTRQGLADWLLVQFTLERPTLVGIDHGFSFPVEYFQKHKLEHDWPTFLDDFCQHWPTDTDIRVDDARYDRAGNGSARLGNPRWRRLTEQRAGAAKSVFHFDVQGSVAKSTHAGLPWLRYLRQNLHKGIHCWPFDGWSIPSGRSAIIEVYPALWSRAYPRADRTPDQHDAYSIAMWLADADKNTQLHKFLSPSLTESEQKIAQVEGWILGVVKPKNTHQGYSGST